VRASAAVALLGAVLSVLVGPGLRLHRCQWSGRVGFSPCAVQVVEKATSVHPPHESCCLEVRIDPGSREAAFGVAEELPPPGSIIATMLVPMRPVGAFGGATVAEIGTYSPLWLATARHRV
jgi:hypothetical protein